MVGDWLFSLEAFGDAAPDRDDRLLDDFADDLSYLGGSRDERRDRLLRTRHEDVPAYLDVHCGHTRLGRRAGGRLQLDLPAEHGVLRAGPPVEAALSGDRDGLRRRELRRRDGARAGALDRLRRRRPSSAKATSPFPSCCAPWPPAPTRMRFPESPAGSAGRWWPTPPAPPTCRLDDLPAPDYDEYFERAGAPGPAAHGRAPRRLDSVRVRARMLVGREAPLHVLRPQRRRRCSSAPSRRSGCSTELAEQARRYRSFRFEAVDNILDMRYLTELFPALIAGRTRLRDLLRGQGQPDPRAAQAAGAGRRDARSSPAWSR